MRLKKGEIDMNIFGEDNVILADGEFNKSRLIATKYTQPCVYTKLAFQTLVDGIYFTVAEHMYVDKYPSKFIPTFDGDNYNGDFKKRVKAFIKTSAFKTAFNNLRNIAE